MIAKFDPELVQIMRTALEEIMQRVPVEYSTQATKAYLAECILKAAAQGQTTFDAFVAAVSHQIPLSIGAQLGHWIAAAVRTN
jgi:hypothetical protein